MTEKSINIETYLKGNNRFKIPPYQRGYKWSEKPKQGQSSVEFFCDSLLEAFNRDDNEYFIEAVTVVQEKENDPILLVDGQQRTITLFLLFVVLNDQSIISGLELKYDVREDSNKYLENISGRAKHLIEDEDTQDIFYFKETIKSINGKLKSIKDRENAFAQFVKEKVFLLFNTIPENKAVNTFIALNGLKAIMKDEELVKSDLLIKSSRIKSDYVKNDIGENEKSAIEWKINEDRGRLARNWDKWLYWWNQPSVKDYFGVKNQHPLYYLLVTYWNLKKGDSKREFSFDNFKNKFISDSKAAKNHFESLRKLQKTFEDLYSNFETFNFLGIILKTSLEKEKALEYVLNNKDGVEVLVQDYAKWALTDARHHEITNSSKEEDKENSNKLKKANRAIELVNEKYVYWDENDTNHSDSRKEFAYRFLMLLNLLEDNKLKRKFDFSIWENRSLEHIYPKSKKAELNFDLPGLEEGSIHCIGNLVLLYGKNNSEFGSKAVPEKKKVFFDTGNINEFKSRNLLHSLAVFANSNWKEREIIANKQETINRVRDYYGI
jgi:hypothetical protein